MLVERLHKCLTTPGTRLSSPQVIFWFSFSLTFSAIYSILGLKAAFRSEYVVSGDTRIYLSWMQRFLDPELLPNDLINDYFQSISPAGYKAFYGLIASIGIEPFLLSKLLPILLGLSATAYCFAICLQILPIPTAGFIASLLLNQNLCVRNDWISAGPRAFVYPLFLAFLYYLLRGSLLPCLVAIALQGLFFPPLLFVSLVILTLRLLQWEKWLPRFAQNQRNYLFFATGWGVALLVMFPYALTSSEFGPVVTLTEARALPEFSAEGRFPFFYNEPLKFWLLGIHSGLLPCDLERYLQLHRMPPLTFAGLLLPILLLCPSRFPLAKQVTDKVTLLPHIILASVAMFFSAHILLYKLYAPSRYTVHSLRFVLALAAGIVLTLVLDGVFRACEQRTKISRKLLGFSFVIYALLLTVYWLIFSYPGGKKNLVIRLALGAVVTLILLLLDWVFHPSQQGVKPYAGRQFLALALTVLLGAALVLVSPGSVSYKVGRFPTLYEFFQDQPKDALIASLEEEADNLPIYSHRSTLVGNEYAIPFHVGYYRQIHQRATDLIRAQYSQDLVESKNFIQKYGVDFWLLDRAAFTSEYLAQDNSRNLWLRQFSPTKEALDRLEQGKIPALADFMKRCSVFESENLVVLQAKCITKAPQS